MIFREPENEGLDCRLFGTIINTTDDCPHLYFMDFYIAKLGEKKAVIELPIEDSHLNLQQQLHHGIMAALMNTTMELAVKTTNYANVPISVQYQYDKVNITKGDFVNGVAEVTEINGDKAQVTCQVITKENQVLANGQGTFQLIDKVYNFRD